MAGKYPEYDYILIGYSLNSESILIICGLMDALPQSPYPSKIESSFNNKLTQVLNYNPNKDKRNKNEGKEE